MTFNGLNGGEAGGDAPIDRDVPPAYPDRHYGQDYGERMICRTRSSEMPYSAAILA